MSEFKIMKRASWCCVGTARAVSAANALDGYIRATAFRLMMSGTVIDPSDFVAVAA